MLARGSPESPRNQSTRVALDPWIGRYGRCTPFSDIEARGSIPYCSVPTASLRDHGETLRHSLILTSLVLPLSLAACGGDKSKDAPKDAPAEAKADADADETEKAKPVGIPNPAAFTLNGGSFDNKEIELAPLKGTSSYWLYSNKDNETLVSIRGEQAGTSVTLTLTLPVKQAGKYVMEPKKGEKPRARMRLSSKKGRQVMELIADAGFVVDLKTANPGTGFLEGTLEGTFLPTGPASQGEENKGGIKLTGGRFRVPFNPAPTGTRIAWASSWDGDAPAADGKAAPTNGYLDFQLDGKQQRWNLTLPENNLVKLDGYQNVKVVGHPAENPTAQLAITVNGHDLDKLKYPATVPAKGVDGTASQPAAAGVTYVDADGDKFVGFAGPGSKVTVKLEKWDPKSKKLLGSFEGPVKSPKKLPAGKPSVLTVTKGKFEVTYK